MTPETASAISGWAAVAISVISAAVLAIAALAVALYRLRQVEERVKELEKEHDDKNKIIAEVKESAQKLQAELHALKTTTMANDVRHTAEVQKSMAALEKLAEKLGLFSDRVNEKLANISETVAVIRATVRGDTSPTST